MLSFDDVNAFGERVSEAVSRVAEDIASGDAVHENPISGQLTGRIKESLTGFETENVRWQVDTAPEAKGRVRLRARQLTSQGGDSEETRYGADIVFCLDIELRDYVAKKGFLAQAKRLVYGDWMNNGAMKELREQCAKMLSITPASMVFLYSKEKIHVVSAVAIAASKSNDVYSIPTYNIDILFRDFAMCWIGDPLLQATDTESLERLRRLSDARSAVLFRATSVAA
ncbi:hypothetical protein [Bradyrhizobium sp. BRP56]|uniref:hypothetical protein n=1 Tax=Bradyrhizobium sp. BRP56 TaxID=2793819 RepID=UPI001CD6457F|nr:hypothetical protein [Bradyrhizobium sp. BRP56]MCA1401332.1 hypothetical protein [Bradyrhizobium sp. BRP56]